MVIVQRSKGNIDESPWRDAVKIKSGKPSFFKRIIILILIICVLTLVLHKYGYIDIFDIWEMIQNLSRQIKLQV